MSYAAGIGRCSEPGLERYRKRRETGSEISIHNGRESAPNHLRGRVTCGRSGVTQFGPCVSELTLAPRMKFRSLNPSGCRLRKESENWEAGAIPALPPQR